MNKYCPLCNQMIVDYDLANCTLLDCDTLAIYSVPGSLLKPYKIRHYYSYYQKNILIRESVYLPNYYIDIYHNNISNNKISTLIYKIHPYEGIFPFNEKCSNFKISKILEFDSNKILDLSKDIEQKINFLLAFS